MFFKGPGDIYAEKKHISIRPKALSEYYLFTGILSEKISERSIASERFRRELIHKYFYERRLDDVTFDELLRGGKEERHIRMRLDWEEYCRGNSNKGLDYFESTNEWKMKNLTYFERFFVDDIVGLAILSDFFDEQELASEEDYHEKTLKKLAELLVQNWSLAPLVDYTFKIYQFSSMKKYNTSGEHKKFIKKYLHILVCELETLTGRGSRFGMNWKTRR